MMWHWLGGSRRKIPVPLASEDPDVNLQRIGQQLSKMFGFNVTVEKRAGVQLDRLVASVRVEGSISLQADQTEAQQVERLGNKIRVAASRLANA